VLQKKEEESGERLCLPDKKLLLFVTSVMAKDKSDIEFYS
jgi:hypothetical protein